MLSGGCGTQHSVCCTIPRWAGRQASCQILGEGAVAALPAATWEEPLFSVGLQKHSRVAWLQSYCLSQIHKRLCYSSAVLGILGERGNRACSSPCKSQAATEPVFPSVQEGLPSPAQPGLLAGRRRSHESAERGGWKIRVSSGLIGTRRSPDNSLWLFRVAQPPLWAWGGLLRLQQCWHARTSYYHDPGPPQPPFHTKIRIAPLSESAAPDSWLLLRSKPYLFFPPPLQAVVHFLQTFRNRGALNRKGNILKTPCRAAFSISTVYPALRMSTFHSSRGWMPAGVPVCTARV